MLFRSGRYSEYRSRCRRGPWGLGFLLPLSPAVPNHHYQTIAGSGPPAEKTGYHGPPTKYLKLRVVHAPGMLSPPPWFSDPNMHHGTCVTRVPWCMPWSLTSGFIWSPWREKRSRHSRRMHNPQFYVSGMRPIGSTTRCLDISSAILKWGHQYIYSKEVRNHANQIWRARLTLLPALFLLMA